MPFARPHDPLRAPGGQYYIYTTPSASPAAPASPSATPSSKLNYPPHLPLTPSSPSSPAPSSPSNTRSVGTSRLLKRIPAPAILPPILDARSSDNSRLHLDLHSRKVRQDQEGVQDAGSGSTLSLNQQIEELLKRHRLTGVATPVTEHPANLGTTTNAGARAPVPPRIPPKEDRTMASSQAPRRPLPVPPGAAVEWVPHKTPVHQYPASYGPSVSRIRPFPAAESIRCADHTYSLGAPGLPSSLIPGSTSTPSGPRYAPSAPQNTDDNLVISKPFAHVAKGRSSIFLHKGFYDLLNLAPPASSPSTAIPTHGPHGEPELYSSQAKSMGRDGFQISSQQPGKTASRSRPQTVGNKRISTAMVGRPTGFTHLAHASDAEQAEEILLRWRIDGKGKLAEPEWVRQIKEQARARARDRAIAQVQMNLDEERKKQPLQVVNRAANDGVSSLGTPTESPSSAFSNKAEHGSHFEEFARTPTRPVLPFATPHPPAGLAPQVASSPSVASPASLKSASPYDDRVIVHDEIPVQRILPPPQPFFLRPPINHAATAGTFVIRNQEALEVLQNGQEWTAQGPLTEGGVYSPLQAAFIGEVNEGTPPVPPIPVEYQAELAARSSTILTKPFKPSLETVERSVATKVYLENHYYGILKRPRDRDQRRAVLERELAAANMTDAQRRAIRAAWVASETEHLRELRNKVSPESFKKIKTIGHGAFGVVSLVREKRTGELYAMKQLRKQDMLKKGQEGHVRAERDLLSQASSNNLSNRWIVKLIYSFQDIDNLFLVMEFLGGGDLLNLLIEKDIFEEDFARFYVAEMVLAIQEAHKLGYIHRDIKPDNFIFSSDGHIKLSDFGLATDFHWAHDGAYYDQQRRGLLKKHGIDLDEGTPLSGGHRFNSSRRSGGLDLSDLPWAKDDASAAAADEQREMNKGILTWREKNRKKLAYSVVGTNSYMSPEVIRGTGYDQSCDWWSLGIILFECLYGYPPFVSKSRHLTRQKILTWPTSLKFPSKPKVSREAQDLIERLICEREDRLGTVSNDPSTIRGVNSLLLHHRRSGFVSPAPAFLGLKDGADDIKAHPWFRGIDFSTLHLQTPPFQPELKDPTDTRYFDDDIEDKPLAPPDAPPGHADLTKDPMLRHQVHGKHLLDKSPKQKVYDPKNGLRSLAAEWESSEDVRGRTLAREASSGFRRAMSL